MYFYIYLYLFVFPEKNVCMGRGITRSNESPIPLLSNTMFDRSIDRYIDRYILLNHVASPPCTLESIQEPHGGSPIHNIHTFIRLDLYSDDYDRHLWSPKDVSL